jgi:hypothetical protein
MYRVGWLSKTGLKYVKSRLGMHSYICVYTHNNITYKMSFTFLNPFTYYYLLSFLQQFNETEILFTLYR